MATGEDRYELQQQLGSGTGGVVHRAVQRDTGTVVAIKTPNTAPATGGTGLGIDVPSLREIKFMQELHHRNVVQLLDVFKSRGKAKINLVMEYMEHGELKGVINDHRLQVGPGHVKGYLSMILDGMDGAF